MFILNKSVLNLAFFLLCLFFLPKIASAANLIQNSGFETEKNNWDLTASTVGFSIVSDTVKEGTKSSKIVYSPTTLSNGIFQSITSVTADKKYKLTVFAKSESTTKKVFLRLRWYQGTTTTDVDSQTLVDATDWTALEIISTAPLSVSKVEIRLHVSGGIGYFDGVSMEEYIEPSATPTPTPTISPTPAPTSSPSSTSTPTPLPNHDNIYISEVMVAPETGLGEWVEIYNGNDFSVSLTNWYIDDIPDAGSSPRLFTVTIPSRSLVVLDLTSSLFNNSGDSVRILDQNKIEKDKIDYEYSEQGKTWGRTDPTNKSTHCLQTPSKGNNNNPCLVTEDSPVSSTTKATKSTQTTTKTSTSTSSTSKTSTSKNTPINYTSQLKRYSIAVTPPTINYLQIEKPNPDVLGVEIEVERKPDYLLSKTLFFLSGSYSFLSLLSIGIKLKLYLG